MRRTYLLCALITLFIIGCSGSSSPVVPGTQVDPGVTHNSETYSNNHVLWGIWDIRIDADTLNAEVTPLRGTDFTCNVTQFMQPPSSPVNMVSFSVLSGSQPADGYFEIEVTLRHPFPGLNQYNGFDVSVILMSNGSLGGDYDNSVLRPGPEDTRLTNPDGYTRWWNYPEFTSYNSIFGFTTGKLAPPNQPVSTVNPYKYFAFGLEADTPVSDLDPGMRGFFPTDPGVISREYFIQFRMDGGQTVFDFQYAVDASWDEPDNEFEPDYPPEAFGLTANCQEAFNISVTGDESTAWYVNETENGGELALDIEIYDWQSAGNPAGVPGEVSSIWLEGPVLGSPVELTSIATVLPGSTTVSSVYEVNIGSLNLTNAGREELFITIENTSPDTYEPQITGGSAFAYPDALLAAYFTFDVEIDGEAPGVQPTVLSIDPDWGWLGDLLTDVTVGGLDFHPACSVELQYESGDSLVITNFQYVDVETLTFDLDLTDVTVGDYDVIVTNPYADPGMLEDGFEVKEIVTGIWPTTQGTRANTGYVEGLYGPQDTFTTPSWNTPFTDCEKGNSLPVFLSDDTAYFSISYNYLDTNHLPATAVNLDDHSVKWLKTINTVGHSSLCVKGISEDGSVVLVYDWPGSYSYGLDADDGSEIWQITANIGSDLYATTDLDGNFIIPVSYVGVMSVDPYSGDINWTAGIGHPWYCCPAVGSDGTIYSTGGDNRIHALDPADGSDNWGNRPYVGTPRNSITVTPDDDILYHSESALYCFTDNGSSYSTKWTQFYAMPWYSAAAVAPNGDIIIFDGNDVMRRLDPEDGTTIYTSSGRSQYATRPAIGEDGLIYVNSNNSNYGTFLCFSADLTLRWVSSGTGPGTHVYYSAPAIGQDGTVYSAHRITGLCAWTDN